MKVLILVVNDSKKKVSSTSGMSTSVLTSELLKYRVAECVPKRIDEIKEVQNLIMLHTILYLHYLFS